MAHTDGLIVSIYSLEWPFPTQEMDSETIHTFNNAFTQQRTVLPHSVFVHAHYHAWLATSLLITWQFFQCANHLLGNIIQCSHEKS